MTTVRTLLAKNCTYCRSVSYRVFFPRSCTFRTLIINYSICTVYIQ